MPPQSLSAPSPTVNTIEALQVVRGLYNASINLGKDSTIDDDHDNNPFDAFQGEFFLTYLIYFIFLSLVVNFDWQDNMVTF